MSGFASGRGRGRSEGDGRGRGEGGCRGEGGGRGEGGRGRGVGGGRGDRGGGGGRGEGRGGRGGRGDGGGRVGSAQGRNRHMGDIPIFTTLVDSITPQEILCVINPSSSDRNRSARLDPLAPPGLEVSVKMPGQAAWRFADPIGKPLDASRNHVITSNHFRLDVSKIPSKLYQYAVHFYPFERTGRVSTEDESPKIDIRISTSLISSLCDNHPEWNLGRGVGLAYNGRSIAFTSAYLPLPMPPTPGNPSLTEAIKVKALDGGDTNRKYNVKITLAEEIPFSASALASREASPAIITALDSSLLAFARASANQNRPEWFLVGSQAFRASSTQFQLSTSMMIALQGYYTSLKVCMAGLVLVCDMATSCFLTGGPIIDIMIYAGNFRSRDDLIDACNCGPLLPRVIDAINETIKNAMISVTHLGQMRKAKSLGPAASAYRFDHEGKNVSVADYFADLYKKNISRIRQAMPSGGLKYPNLPCINIGGSVAEPILIPAELVEIAHGQCRTRAITPAMTAKLIKYSAVRPQERMQFLSDPNSIVNVIRVDPIARAFGTSEIATVPIVTPFVLLPQAKLLYRGNKTIDPKLSGSWNVAEKKCEFNDTILSSCPKGYIPYGILIISPRFDLPPDYEEKVNAVIKMIEGDSRALGCNIQIMRGPKGEKLQFNCNPDLNDIKANLSTIKSARAKFAFVILTGDFYGMGKFVADTLGLTTQMLRWKNVDCIPQGYGSNIMLKVNHKLGGTNHTLTTRLTTSTGAGGVFQSPPASIGWMFDVPCMLVGMDVSHGEIGSKKESIAAIVGSVDNKVSQYAGHISAQASRVEMIVDLVDGMRSLFETFKSRNNGKMPHHVIVYRDGVSEGQFDSVLTKELPLIQEAIALMGYDESSVKVSIIICQKNHHSRFAYNERLADGSMALSNLCPGTVHDATARDHSLTSAHWNEFYLNSHVAIQGHSKPCKYSLIYDEIGMKLSELQLLTYWTTYLYCRANKSVSYAAPAYYAHWLSKRGGHLSNAGATNVDLKNISRQFMNMPNPMFFV